MIDLFEALNFLFPHKFAAQFSTGRNIEIGMQAWEMALEGLTKKDLKIGLKYCAKKPMPFFPSPAEFRSFCQLNSNAVWGHITEVDDPPEISNQKFVDHFKKLGGEMRHLAPSLRPLYEHSLSDDTVIAERKLRARRSRESAQQT